MAGMDDEEEPLPAERRRAANEKIKLPEPTPLEEVVGVILGSPEFQRR
jgi:hypothetical protein